PGSGVEQMGPRTGGGFLKWFPWGRWFPVGALVAAKSMVFEFGNSLRASGVGTYLTGRSSYARD
ncbi:MAG: hypothetical protein ACRD1T_09370, partial [Acidimicrobiia bacterium]